MKTWWARDGHGLSVCRGEVKVHGGKQWTEFYEMLYENYSIGAQSNGVLLNFLQSVITTWRTHELVRWKQH